MRPSWIFGNWVPLLCRAGLAFTAVSASNARAQSEAPSPAPEAPPAPPAAEGGAPLSPTGPADALASPPGPGTGLPRRDQAPSASSSNEQYARRPWRGSWLVWQNTVTTQTVGIGGNYQSADPTYEMSAWIRPRYYFVDSDEELGTIGGRVDVIREFTNSDVTTEQGETTLSDATLYTSYSRRVTGHGAYGTRARVTLPILTFPTSKFSYSNGTYLGLGGGLGITEAVPLVGKDAPVLGRVQFSGAISYNHTFTRAVVPSNPGLRRVRMDPDGNTVPGDELVGAAFPEHELELDARMFAEITDRLGFYVEGSYRPTWKYGFSNVPLGNVRTGTVIPELPDNPTRYVVLTQFETFIGYDVTDELSVSLGYINLEQQPAPDGQRRSIFWSPGAQFYVQVIGRLDAIYLALTGRRGQSPSTSFWL